MPWLVMAASFLGFGALVKSLGVTLETALFSIAFIWALPGQVVFVTMLAQGAGFFAIALAVTLTAIRLLPMVLLVLAKSRQQGEPRWPEFLLAHLTAVTLWVIANQHMDTMPREQRLPWSIGMGLTLATSMIAVTTLGYVLSDALPPLVAAAMVFLTPSFFFISLLASAYYRFDYAAILLGSALTPVGMYYVPQFDLLFAGLLGGTLAFLALHPRLRRRSRS